MKKLRSLLALLFLVLLCNGCALIPKPVELFQKKVHAFPEASAKLVEVQKETAQRAKEAARTTFETALQQDVSPELRADARDTVVLTDAVATSIGPPAKPSGVSADLLAKELRAEIARLNQKIDAFQEQNEKVAGKKIEGTGWLQIPYFVYLAVVIFVLIIGWHLLHTVVTGLQVAGVANPALGVAGSVGSAAMSEIETMMKKVMAGAQKVASEVTTKI
jgi:hypothetical protein